MLHRSRVPSIAGEPCAASLSRGFAGRRRRLLQSVRSASTTSNRLEPRPSRGRMARASLRSHASRDSPGQDQIGFRRTGAVRHDKSRWIALPQPRLARTPHVMSPGIDRLEKPAHPGAHQGGEDSPAEPSGASRSRGGFAFAKPAAERPAFAGHPASRTASHVPPRRRSWAAAPEVSSIVGEHLQEGWTRPGKPSKVQTTQRVNPCPQVVPNLWKRIRAFCIPRRALL